MSSWPETRIRYLADINPRVPEKLLAEPTAEVSFLPMEAIGEGGAPHNLERTRPVAEVRNGYSYFADGDVVFAKVTPCFENGKGGVVQGLQRGAGFGTTELTVLRPREGVDARFLNYVLQQAEFRQAGVSSMLGAGGLKRIPDDFVRDFKVPCPSPSEQERIANFLDEQTARIDALIAEKEKLLARLDELRRSITYALVTGTSDGDGCATGSRYFPHLANGWHLTRLKYLVVSLDSQRIPLSGEERATRHGPYPYYGASGQIDSIDAYLFDESLVLVGEDGANLVLRSTPLAFVAEGKYWVNNHAHVLRPKDGRVHLWARVIDTLDVTDWVSGAAQPKLTAEALMNLPVPCIPEAVRSTIEAAILEKESRITALESHTLAHVERLREYRSSLISAAVTGQLKII